MTIEYKIRFEDGGLTITATALQPTTQQIAKQSVSGGVVAAHELGSSFPLGKGAGENPDTRSGTGENPDTRSGTGENPDTRSGTGVQNGSFDMEHQEEGNWCWAAVSASVDRYFDPAKALAQCAIASKVLAVKDCCYDKDAHNEGAALEDALGAVNRQRGEAQSGSIKFEKLQSEIDSEMPVCVRIGWTKGGAHFVSLYGYRIWDSGARTIEVGDPWYGNSTQDFDQFPAYYRGGGQWTDTFLTKK
jgi:hypothetical protein